MAGTTVLTDIVKIPHSYPPSWIFNPEYSLEGLMLKLKLQYCGPPDVKNWLIGKDPDAGKDWRQEEKGATEDEMVGWHHRLNGHEFEQTLGDSERQRSLVCCVVHGVAKSQTKLSGWTTLPPGLPLHHTPPWQLSVSSLINTVINHTERLKTRRLGPMDLIRAWSDHAGHPYSWQKKIGEWKGLLYLPYTTI